MSRAPDVRRGTTLLGLVLLLAASCSHATRRPDALRVVAPRNSPAALANLVPLYALAHADAHLLTTAPSERSAKERRGWTLDGTPTSDCDGVVGYAYDRNVTWQVEGRSRSTVALYRFVDHPTGGFHYETIVGSADQVRARLARLAAQGFRHPIRLGYVFSTARRADATDQAHALRSFVDPATHESYASVDPRPRPGFRQDAVIAYVTTGATLRRRTGNAPQGTELCPLTLLTKGSGAGALQYATTDLADRTRHLATGWSLDDGAVGGGADGIAGYLWSKRVPGTGATVRSYDSGPPTFRIDTVQAHEATTPASGRTVLGYGFAVHEPGTAALAAFTNERGAWRYATTAAGAREATAHGFRAAAAPVQLLPDPDAGAPYFEVHGPALATSNRAVIAIHGGAWMGGVYTTFPIAQLPPHLGPPQTSAGDSIDDMTRRYTALGWTVYDVDYHSGGVRGLRELQAFYDSLRQSAPSAKVCTAGASAGAHLALMLAAHNPAIVCVVALAAPTDLHSLVRNGPIDGAMVRNGIGPDSGDLWRANSPVALLGRSRAATLLVTAADDHVVPWSQAAELEAVMRAQGARWVQALQMSPGPLEFVHGTTNAGAVELYLLTERCLLLQTATPGASCSSGPAGRHAPS